MIQIDGKSQHVEGVFGLTPLIDVIFMLILFFMLTGSMVRGDPFEIALPVATGGNAPPAAALIVDVSAFGDLAVDGETIARAALADRVAEWAAHAPERDVVVRADAGASTGDLMAILRLLRRGGAVSARLATEPEGAPPGYRRYPTSP